MAEFRIAIDLSHLMRAGSAFTKDALPHLALAVHAVADRVEARWKLYASGAPMPNGKTIGNRSGGYLRSIMQRSTGDFSAEVYSESPHAQAIESGSPRRDLKTMLNSSLKVRLSKAGKRYLIIPFRHSANPNNVARDNVMPASVHEWWTKSTTLFGKTYAWRQASHVLRRGHLIDPSIKEMLEGSGIDPPADARFDMTRLSGTRAVDIKTGMTISVPRHRYEWGDRLTKTRLAGLGIEGEDARHLLGMVMFRKPGKTGGAAHSRFLTFRTMVEGSKGWISPAQEGKWPARQVADIYRPVAEEAFRAAVEADIRTAMPGVTS